jgi:hypothetical protein
MNTTALIVHPAYSPVLPLYTARELMLAAACMGLKAQVVEQATKITQLEERNRALTKALHRQACAGHALPEVLGLIVLIGAALTIGHSWGNPGLISYAVGFFFGLAWMILLPRRRRAAACIQLTWMSLIVMPASFTPSAGMCPWARPTRKRISNSSPSVTSRSTAPSAAPLPKRPAPVSRPLPPLSADL